MQLAAEELRCSVREVVADDPITIELRQYAILKVLAEAQAEERRREHEPAAT